MSKQNTQIEKKIPSKNLPSPAVLAATLSALAGAASAGHTVNVDSSKIDISLSENIQATLKDAQFKKELQENAIFDFSVFHNHLAIDNEETIISEDLLMLATGVEQWVDGDATSVNKIIPNPMWDTDCYTNCHSNCHGSRSWR